MKVVAGTGSDLGGWDKAATLEVSFTILGFYIWSYFRASRWSPSCFVKIEHLGGIMPKIILKDAFVDNKHN